MSIDADTFDPVSADILSAVTEECIVLSDHALLQTGCNCHRLRRGTRLVGIVYTVVSPHLVPGIHPAFIRHGSDLLLGVGAAQISRIIQVESPVGGHGKDLAVSRVHGDDSRCLASDPAHPLIDIFFHDALDVHVDGGNDRVSVLGGLDDLLHVGLIIQIAVLSSVCSCQLVVVILLDPAASLFSVIIGKADHIAGQRVVRVKSPVLILKPDTFDLLSAVILRLCVGIVQFLLLCLEFFLLIRGDLLLIRHIVGILVCGDHSHQVRPVVPEHLAEGGHRRLQIVILILVDLIRVEDQVVDLLARRQIRSVSVHDITAAVRDRPAVVGGMLVQYDLGVVCVFILDHPV